jgi:uncharacterized protein YkwD
MWRRCVLVLGLALLTAGCTAPVPTVTVTSTLLPVAVQVIVEATPTPPPASASPTFVPTATPSPTPTKLPPSPTATQSPVVPTQAASAPTETALPQPPSPTAAATIQPSATSKPAVAQSNQVVAPDVAAAEQHTLDLINAQRAAQSLPPLARDETLMGIARARVADMVARHYTGHYDPVTGEGLGKALMRAAGYTSGFMAENWYGHPQGPAEAVEVAMNWFMGDPPHADNILSPNFVGVGVGLAFNGQEWLLVQDFAGKNR